MSSTEDPNDIFILANTVTTATGTMDLASGIACRTTNGWFLSGCTRADVGTGGDSDMVIAIDLDGNEYCVTSDFVQPHQLSEPWASMTIALYAVCLKYDK